MVLRLNTCAQYGELLIKCGVSNTAPICGNMMKRKLLVKFGNCLSFLQPWCRKDSALVYSNVMQALNSLASVSPEPELSGDKEDFATPVMKPSTASLLYNSASVIRQELCSIERCIQWPPSPEDISSQTCNLMIPDLLHNFLAWVIEGDDKCSKLDARQQCSEDINRQIMSLAQDMIYCARKAD